MKTMPRHAPRATLAPVTYQTIYAVVRRIPKGQVATYGQIAKLVGRCTPRMVGYAMAAVPKGTRVPWHRVVNSQGSISVRTHGDGAQRQRSLLEREGVLFDRQGKLSFERYRWEV
jgi:O-6-methylguanine DNA methyltransferase